ncbi:recombinase family protein [Candidatus Marinimicrobia bacterium]|nr:recombinase family protein [Candidatus Neomarinimicrobiota bacterium]
MNIGLGRLSSITQMKGSSESLKNQKLEVERYLHHKGLKLDLWIEDIMTGTTSDRDGLNQIKELVDTGVRINTIVVYDLTRLMRSFTEGVVFIKFLMDNEISIVSTKEEINTSTPSGRFFLNILLSYSQMDRDMIVEKLKLSRKSLLDRKNKRPQGRIPFSYKKIDREVVLDSEQSKIVEYIYKRWITLKHLSPTSRMRKLIKSLNRKGFDYNGKEWCSKTIRYILSNPFYKGILKVKWDGNTIEKKHNYPRVVSTQLWNKVQSVC